MVFGGCWWAFVGMLPCRWLSCVVWGVFVDQGMFVLLGFWLECLRQVGQISPYEIFHAGCYGAEGVYLGVWRETWVLGWKTNIGLFSISVL